MRSPRPRGLLGRLTASRTLASRFDALGADAGLRTYVELVVVALVAPLRREHGPQPAADERERDREDRRVVEPERAERRADRGVAAGPDRSAQPDEHDRGD